MTKRREPQTIESALDQAVGLVGIDRVAGMIGKSTDMVRKFADPDNDTHHLQLRQALEIDRQLALIGHERPFAELVAALEARNVRASEQVSRIEVIAARPMHEAAAAVCLASDLVAKVEAAESDQEYSAAEIDALCKAVNALQKKMPAVRAAIVAKRRVRR